MKSSIGPGIFIVLFLANQAVSQELNSTLHSTLYGVQVAYVDEMVVFTCVVRGSDSMAWTSEDYIGIGGQQLPFAAVEPVNSERRAIGNNQTVATLITAVNTGDILIVSELRIRIKSTFPVASVQCISRGADVATVNSTSFQLADAASVACDRQFLCPGETTITCFCATGSSNTLAWTVNGTRLNFTSSNAVLMRRDIPGSSGYAVLTENSIVNGIRVIASNITIPVSSNDVILICGNVDQNMMEPITIPTVENCPVSPSGATPSGSDSADSCTGAIVAAVLIPVAIMILITILIVVIFIVKYRSLQSKLKIKDDQISRLETDVREKIRVKDEAVGKLPAKMTAEWKEALKMLESNVKRTVLSTLKENITAKIAPEKGKSGGGPTKKGSRKSKESRLSIDEAARQLESKTIDEILKDLPAEMKSDCKAALEERESKIKAEWKAALESKMEEERTTVVKGIVMAEIDKAMPKRGTGVEPKSESKKRGPKALKSKEISIDEATKELESKMVKFILSQFEQSQAEANLLVCDR